MIRSDIGLYPTRDVSKLLHVISGAVRRVKFETILKYHVQIMLLFINTTTCIRFVFQIKLRYHCSEPTNLQ